MSARNIPPPPPAVKVRQPRGLFGHIQIVVTVAFLVATLFTALTPEGLFPDSLAQNLSSILAPAQATAPASWPTATARPRPHIGIVAGHWGNDSGAVCPDGQTEASLNLEVATRVKESLTGQGYEVDLLKEFDTRLDSYNALMLVSIHTDSCMYINDQATGFKVSAAMSTYYPEKAARLTSCLRQRYMEATNLPFHAGSVTADMTSYHAFEEINPDTTAAIIEIGFLNLDGPWLLDNEDLVAQGITNGILCFVRNEDLSTPPTQIP